MTAEDVTVRPIDFARDEQPLRAFIDDRDKMRLEHCEIAVKDGDCFVFVADEAGVAVGWAMAHVKYRTDQDWEPDPETEQFHHGENAYLENISVTARLRSQGVGSKLIEAVEAETKRRGKRALWLHTSENNVMAHKLFEREGWTHERSVTPPWKPAARMRVYRKKL